MAKRLLKSRLINKDTIKEELVLITLLDLLVIIFILMFKLFSID